MIEPTVLCAMPDLNEDEDRSLISRLPSDSSPQESSHLMPISPIPEPANGQASERMKWMQTAWDTMLPTVRRDLRESFESVADLSTLLIELYLCMSQFKCSRKNPDKEGERAHISLREVQGHIDHYCQASWLGIAIIATRFLYR